MTTVEEVMYDIHTKKMAEYVQSTSTSCYNCTIGTKEDIVEETIGYYEDPKIQYVHDFEIHCDTIDIKTPARRDFIQRYGTKKKPSSIKCAKGNKQNKGIRCSQCKYASKPIEAVVANEGSTDREIHTLYQCKKNNEKGDYYRGYYHCSDFEGKD